MPNPTIFLPKANAAPEPIAAPIPATHPYAQNNLTKRIFWLNHKIFALQQEIQE